MTVKKNKTHFKSVPKYIIEGGKHGPIGLCGAIWVEVTKNESKVTCKRCLKKLADRDVDE